MPSVLYSSIINVMAKRGSPLCFLLRAYSIMRMRKLYERKQYAQLIRSNGKFVKKIYIFSKGVVHKLGSAL